MADAKPSFKAKLALVDENFVVPADFAKRPIEEQRELRDTSLLANGIKEGKRRALAEKLSEAHAAELVRLSETHAAKDAHWKQIVQHVRLGSRAFGAAFIGIPIGAAIVLIAGSIVMGESFRQAGDYGSQMVATGAAQQAVSPPTPCVPGEQLPDGRRCPSPDMQARAANGEAP